MIDVLDSTKELYMNSSHKELTITFPNKNIVLHNTNLLQEDVELTELLETEKQLSFKGCNSSSFQFSMAGLLQDVRDEYLEVSVKAGNTESIPLFSGYVVSQNNRNYEDVVTKLECQDVLYKKRNIDVTAWYNGLTFPITVKNFRNSFFTYLGIDQVVDVHDEEASGDLINDSLTLTKMNAAKLPKVLNAGDIMQYICQINARYGQYGRDKKFHYRQLREIIKGLYPSYETFPSPTTYPSGENANVKYDLSLYSKIQYEPYMVENIDGVTIRDNEGNSTHYGNTTNVFEIADNFLASSLSDKATACQNIYNEIKVVWYIPVELNCVGFPWIECGDIILTRTKKNMVRTYVLQRTLKGIQALFDTMKSSGEQYRELYKESEATGVSTNRSGVKANADEIVATKLRVSSIEADYIKTAQLNAVDAKIDNLTAIAITTQNLSAQSINGSQIVAGSITAGKIASNAITADKIDADAFSGNRFEGKTAHFGTVQSTNSTIYLGGVGYSWKEINVSGTPYYALCSSGHP